MIAAGIAFSRTVPQSTGLTRLFVAQVNVFLVRIDLAYETSTGHFHRSCYGNHLKFRGSSQSKTGVTPPQPGRWVDCAKYVVSIYSVSYLC
jgi:hypothetical protein